jgi:hypothetical protein
VDTKDRYAISYRAVQNAGGKMSIRNVVAFVMLTMALVCGCRSIPEDGVAYPAGGGELTNSVTGEVIDVGPK